MNSIGFDSVIQQRKIWNAVKKEKRILISKAIKWAKVGAVGIEMVGYDFSDNKLYVKFRNNKNIYRYYDVEENIYKSLMRQEHKTTFINKEIKGNYEYEALPLENLLLE